MKLLKRSGLSIYYSNIAGIGLLMVGSLYRRNLFNGSFLSLPLFRIRFHWYIDYLQNCHIRFWSLWCIFSINSISLYENCAYNIVNLEVIYQTISPINIILLIIIAHGYLIFEQFIDDLTDPASDCYSIAVV